MAEIQERAFRFALRVVSVADHMSRGRGVGKQLRYQLLSSGTSIGANLAEADGACSRADFISKCSIAAKEARETLYWLNLISRAGTISERRLRPLIDEAGELVAILTTIVKNSSTKC